MRIQGTYSVPIVSRDTIPGSHEPGFTEHPIRAREVDDRLRKSIHGGARLLLGFYTMGECSIIRAREPLGINGEYRWHLSISHPTRHPSWDEIKTARYRLLPHEVAVAIILPPPEFYVNVPAQDHVFHLHEIEDPARPWETM